MEGYIKLSRKFFTNPLWTEPREYSRAEAWIDLIQSAKFETQCVILKGRAVEVRRGEIVASRRYLEVRWRWSNTKVDNFINLLVQQGMVAKRNANQNTVLTLTNYGLYNDSGVGQNATRTPPKRQCDATRTPNINKDKRDKKDDDILSFEMVWTLYDKMVGDKERLCKKWNRLTDDDKRAVFDYIPKYKLSQPDKQYRKHFETFLNNRSWNDEIITSSGNGKPNSYIADTKRIGVSQQRSDTF